MLFGSGAIAVSSVSSAARRAPRRARPRGCLSFFHSRRARVFTVARRDACQAMGPEDATIGAWAVRCTWWPPSATWLIEHARSRCAGDRRLLRTPAAPCSRRSGIDARMRSMFEGNERWLGPKEVSPSSGLQRCSCPTERRSCPIRRGDRRVRACLLLWWCARRPAAAHCPVRSRGCRRAPGGPGSPRGHQPPTVVRCSPRRLAPGRRSRRRWAERRWPGRLRSCTRRRFC